MNRIQQVSGFFLMAFKFLLVFLPIYVLFKWVFINAGFMDTHFFQAVFMTPFHAPAGYVSLPDITWSPLTQVLGLGAYLVDLSPILISLIALMGIFKQYQHGEFFSAMNARGYRLLGWMFIFDGLIASPLADMLLSLAVSFNSPPGERYISLAFGSPNIEAVFCGAIVIVISWVMLEASKLHEDQRLTV